MRKISTMKSQKSQQSSNNKTTTCYITKTKIAQESSILQHFGSLWSILAHSPSLPPQKTDWDWTLWKLILKKSLKYFWIEIRSSFQLRELKPPADLGFKFFWNKALRRNFWNSILAEKLLKFYCKGWIPGSNVGSMENGICMRWGLWDEDFLGLLIWYQIAPEIVPLILGVQQEFFWNWAWERGWIKGQLALVSRWRNPNYLTGRGK